MKRFFIHVAIITVALFLFSATAYGGSQREERPPELFFLTLDNPSSYAAIELTDKYFQETGVRVNIDILTADGIHQRVVTQGVARSGEFDLLRISPPGPLSEYAAAGWIQPLDPFIEMFGFEDELRDWPRGVLESHAFVNPSFTDEDADTVWALPREVASLVLMYRTDLFEDPDEKAAFLGRFGYELRPPETWEQLTDITKFFTRDTTGDGNTDLWGYWERFLPGGVAASFVSYRLIWSSGTPLLDENFRPAFNTDHLVYALHHFKDLFDNVMPDTVYTGDFGEFQSMWMAGEFALATSLDNVARRMTNPSINPNTSGVTGIAQIPVYEQTRLGRPFLGGGSYGIMADSRHPEEAARFLFWLMGKDGALDDYIEAGGTPPRRYFLDSAKNDTPVGRAMGRLLSEDRVGNRDALPGAGAAVYDELSDMLWTVLTGEVTPETAVNRAEQAIEAVLGRVGYYDD